MNMLHRLRYKLLASSLLTLVLVIFSSDIPPMA